MRTTAIVGLVLICAAPPAGAGPILESAERLAAGVQPSRSQPSCLTASLAGRDAADQRERTGAYFVGGIVLPVVMPLLAGASSPTPPAALAEGRSSAAAGCFRDGYRQRAREMKADSGWAGSGFGLAIAGLVIVAITAGGGTDIEFPF